jgi:hypothetical protein
MFKKKALAPAAGERHVNPPAIGWSLPVWRSHLLLFTAIALLAFVAGSLALSLQSHRYEIDAGSFRGGYFFQDAHAREMAADGRAYRWTEPESAIYLGRLGISRDTILTLDLGSRPAPAIINVDLAGQGQVSFEVAAQPRHYELLLPIPRWRDTIVGLSSPPVNAPDDPRPLGLSIEGVGLQLPATAIVTVPPSVYLAQLLLLLITLVTLQRLGWGRRVQALVLALMALALAFMLGSVLLVSYVYLVRLISYAVLLALLTLGVLAIAPRYLARFADEREIRLLWSLTLLACAIRLIGVLYPTFGGQDLGLNLRRLNWVIDGQMVIIANSGEFGGGRTIYPPGPYLLVLPALALSGDQAAVLQGILAMLDGISAFFVALLTLLIGGNRAAARVALLLYAGNIAAFGALSYGFSAQIFGQWLTAPIALLLMSARDSLATRVWFTALTLLLVAVLSHIGVAILNVSWIGLVALLLLWRDRARTPLAGGALLVCGGLAYGLLYSEIAGIMLAHVFASSDEMGGTLVPGWTWLLVRGALLAFSAAGWLLLPLGIRLYLRRGPRREEAVVPLAAFAIAVFYLLVDLLTGYQVRYFYFILPFFLAFLSLPLGLMARRGPAGRLTTIAFTGLLIAGNIMLWYAATMASGQISMTPLTH